MILMDQKKKGVMGSSVHIDVTVYVQVQGWGFSLKLYNILID